MGQKSCQMPLRIPVSLHRDLKKAAEQEGVSLNQYSLYLLSRGVAASKEWYRKKGEELFKFLVEAGLLQEQFDQQRDESIHSVLPEETPKQRWKRIYYN